MPSSLQIPPTRPRPPGRNPHGPLGYKTRQSEVKLAPGQTVHYRPGLGFYADTKGVGARGEALAKPAPRGGSSAAPTDKAAAGAAAAVAAGAPTAADLITQYGLAKAKILQAMAPQIQGIYSNATKDLTGVVGGLTDDVRSRLFGAGQDASGDLARQLGGLTQTLGTNVTPSFHPDETANAAYALGAAFPGESLTKQGAAFGAAASFLPAASLEQTQMALTKELQSEGVTASKAANVSASVSKLLGYVSDAQGNPIRDAKGKVIPVQSSATKSSAAKYHYMQPGDGFTYAYDPATGKTQRVGPGITRGAKGASGKHYQYKTPGDGFTYVFDPAVGKLTKIGPGPKKAPPKAPSSMNAAQVTSLTKLVQQWHDGVKTIVANPNPLAPNPTVAKIKQKPISYQVALRRLMSKSGYKMTLKQAQDFLSGWWKPGEGGRPIIDYQDRQILLKLGYPKKLVNAISSDPEMYDIFYKLSGGDISSLGKLTARDKAILRSHGLPI